MLVQLRRVVYLLVLLQCCCFCVTHGNGIDPEKHDDGEFRRAERMLKGWLGQSKEMLAEGNGCLNLLRKQTALCENSTELSRRLIGIVGNVRQKEEVIRQETINDDSKAKKFRDLVAGVEKALADGREAVIDMSWFVEEAKQAGIACFIIRDNLEDVLKKLGYVSEYYAGEVKKHGELGTGERQQIAEEGLKLNEDLRHVVDELSFAIKRSRNPWNDARNRVKEALETMEAVIKQINATAEGMQEPGGKPEVKRVKEEVKRIARTEKRTLEGTRGLSEVKPRTDEEWAKIGKGETIANIGAEISEHVVAEIKRKLEEEKQAVIRRVGGEMTQDEERKREQQRKAAEEKARLAENERKKAEERAKQEEERKTAEEKSRKATEEEKAGKAKEEETKTLAEEAERKAGEKAEQFAVEAVNKTKEKNKDGSSSPALLHGPLLLLVLLCVLGCTLVC